MSEDALDRMAYLMARQLDRERRDGTITLEQYHEQMAELRKDRDAAKEYDEDDDVTRGDGNS